MADEVGGRVAFFRARQKVSAEELARRCKARGMPSITRTVITKLENKRRDAVSTAEVQVLAAALGVPPLALLYPLGERQTAEILPGETRPVWEAVTWFTGETAVGSREYILGPDGESGAKIVTSNQDTAIVQTYSTHQYLADLWMRQSLALASAPAGDASAEAEKRDRAQRESTRHYQQEIEVMLRQHRGAMRAMELALPPLAPELGQAIGEGS
jgi:transcriptional regulator with XRE-family HTH domain